MKIIPLNHDPLEVCVGVWICIDPALLPVGLCSVVIRTFLGVNLRAVGV